MNVNRGDRRYDGGVLSAKCPKPTSKQSKIVRTPGLEDSTG